MPSYVTEEHWSSYLNGMPMPDDATAEMLWAARDAMDEIELREEAATGLDYHTRALNYYQKRLQTAIEKGGPTDNLESIIKSTEEIIESYRSLLV